MSLFLSCPFHALTGLDCPLCGATRATLALLDGDVAGAFDLNPLLVLALPLLAWLAASRSVRLLTARALPEPRIHPAVVVAVGFTFAVLRNLPVPAFAWMASGS